ncbi:MAG: DUF1549 domain-containing protein, partial [Verrucomicrobiota bacterium]
EQAGAALAEENAFFRDKIYPILKNRCFECHGNDEKPKAHLHLTSHKNMLEGGDFGPAIDVDDPARSLFLRMISYKDTDHEMPPKQKLPDDELALLTEWVMMKAPFDSSLETYHAKKAKPGMITEAAKQHWAYRPVRDAQAPAVEAKDWVKSPIDAFILSGLEQNGLRPNGQASKATLIRRAYYNLTGLAPTPEQVEAFLDDSSPDAFEKVIDELLDSQHYGEKWARHWLDLVRYAESNGYERDSVKDYAWRYRDYVIKAFNDDKPYDRFVMEQLAGDELDDVTGDSVTGTGFHRLGVWDDEPADRELARYDYLDDIVRTCSEVMLGMTIGCARCHDHKIDPISQKDYYAFMSFFANISPHGKGRANLVSVANLAQQAEYEKKMSAKTREEAA